MFRVVATALAVGGMFLSPLNAQEIASPSADADLTVAPLLEQVAAPYVRFRSDVAIADEMDLRSAKSLRDTHRRMASHDAMALGDSMIAFAALIAAETPEFANAIAAQTKNRRRKAAFIENLTTNWASVRDIKGADAAMASIVAVTAADATRLNRIGDRFVADAYRLQEQGWARARLPENGTARVRSASQWAATRGWPAISALPTVEGASVRQPDLSTEPNWSTSWSKDLPATPAQLDTAGQVFLSRALALGARYAVGEVTEADLAAFGATKSEKRCFRMAELNLAQCIAATRTAYEEAFCLGTHALNDLSSCVGWVADAGTTKG